MSLPIIIYMLRLRRHLAKILSCDNAILDPLPLSPSLLGPTTPPQRWETGS